MPKTTNSRTAKRVLPTHVTTDDNRRRLTMDDIRNAPMCDANRRAGLIRAERAWRNAGDFIDETNWVSAQVSRLPRTWKKNRASDMATVHQGDLRWAARNLLPAGWYEIYRDAVAEGIRNGRLMLPSQGGARGNYARRMKVRFAVFAALYVEAGRP